MSSSKKPRSQKTAFHFFRVTLSDACVKKLTMADLSYYSH